MNDLQLLRYSRHLLLPDLGPEGQERLSGARVLLVGAGGLGSGAGLYLAAAGVGRLTVADADTVDLSNLQRQVVHDTASLGQNKAESCARRLRALNPEVEILTQNLRLAGEALDAAVAGADVVVDASDNFATRHALNRAAVIHRKPLVSGAALGWEGQLTVFDRRDRTQPCYACLFPEAALPEAQRCAESGVFAPLVGTVGALQAAEALKLITGAGTGLTGWLLLVDARRTEFRRVRYGRDPACAVCGGASADRPSR